MLNNHRHHPKQAYSHHQISNDENTEIDDPDIDGPSTRNKVQTNSQSQNMRNLCSFFIFGILNNILYVIFLSSSQEILENESGISKSSVLLADIFPCLIVKIISPWFVNVLPYGLLIAVCCALSLSSLLLVALSKSIFLKFLGIVLASSACGLGETAFMALSSVYDGSMVISWSSGTGAAGVFGSLFYLLCKSVLDLSLQTTLLISCILPFVMLFTFFVILDVPRQRLLSIDYLEGDESDVICIKNLPSTFLLSRDAVDDDGKDDRVEEKAHAVDPHRPNTPQTSKFAGAHSIPDSSLKSPEKHSPITTLSKQEHIKEHLKSIQPLILKYMAPLFLVYFAEYTINQAVLYALLLPLENTRFRTYNDFYIAYQFLYQIGVFISRSFGRHLPIDNIWIFAILQCSMLLVLSVESSFQLIANIDIMFMLILFEGLLGGSAYVNAFCSISNHVSGEHIEFAMAFTSIADSFGITLAALICLYYQPYLCDRNYICRSL